MKKEERDKWLADVADLGATAAIAHFIADIAYQLTRIADELQPAARMVVEANKPIFGIKPAPDALVEGIKEAIHLMKNEFLPCINNDCECRKGFGLCSQCKEAIYSFVVKYEPILAAHKPEVDA